LPKRKLNNKNVQRFFLLSKENLPGNLKKKVPRERNSPFPIIAKVLEGFFAP